MSNSICKNCLINNLIEISYSNQIFLTCLFQNNITFSIPFSNINNLSNECFYCNINNDNNKNIKKFFCLKHNNECEINENKNQHEFINLFDELNQKEIIQYEIKIKEIKNKIIEIQNKNFILI